MIKVKDIVTKMPENKMKDLKECLVCGNKYLTVHCDLGQQPLVNNLKNSPEEKDFIYPLVVMECPVCTHKQLSVAVDRELLFKDYLYQTGTSDKHLEFLLRFAYDTKGDSVLDIGCNDGSLLVCFKHLGRKVLGIEPSIELCRICGMREIETINNYFPIRSDWTKRFDVITAFNVFAHNENPHTFLIEMAKLLKENGRIYILTTPARLDNFYHEHISYFTPQSMMVLAQRCGVEFVSFKTVSMHGESYLFEIKKRMPITVGVLCLIEWENKNNYNRILRLKKRTVIAYGASASETVLFNYYKIKPEYVVDDNPLKQGKFIPGINSPIVNSDHLAKDPRDLTIIVAHHLFDEISAKIKELRPKHKDRFERLI